MNSFISVDPGYNTGIAHWIFESGESLCVPVPSVSFFSVPSAIKGTEERLSWAWKEFDYTLSRLVAKRWPGIVYIEDTALWQENLTSLVSGSSGDLLTLTKLIGGYCYTCVTLDIEFKLVSVENWKGQISKDAVKRRIFRETGWTFKNDHMTDAVGIGLSMINHWRVTK